MRDSAAIAGELLTRCRRDGGRLASLPELTEAEAYAAQAAVATALGERVGGWKVALVGGRAVAAPLLGASILASGARIALRPDRSLKLEVELGFTLARDLPVGPLSRDDLFAAIASVHAVFEVVGPRGGEPPHTPFTAFLADNLGNAATVLAAGMPLGDLPGLGRLSRDGDLLAEGLHPHGDPLAALLAYVALQPDALGGLKRGQLIITGSFTGAAPVATAGHFTGAFDGLAPVELAFIEGERG